MGKNILIVDDEPDITAYLSAVLQAHGYSPLVAADAEAGLKVASEVQPDLICLDIMMPRESGISMYKRLKRDPDLKSIPVMIISGVALEGKFDFRLYVPDQSVPPPDRFMEKPIDVGKYIEVIEQLIS